MSKIFLNKLIREAVQQKLTGGLSDGLTLDDIAKKHNVSIEDIKKQFEMGSKVEMEHTDNPKVAEKIARDHLYENPKYYSMLKKMESSIPESNLTFHKYRTILMETSLEDIGVTGEEHTEENIGMLHEIEYKMHKIINNRWSVHPKLFKNVLYRFSNIALRLYKILERQFSSTFEWWQSEHQTETAQSFANMVWNSMEENYSNPLEAANTNGISWNSTTKLKPSDVGNEVTGDALYKIIKNFYSGGDDIIGMQTYAARKFLEESGVEIPDDLEDEEEFFKEYIINNDLEDAFFKYLGANYSYSDLFGDFGNTVEMWKEAIAKKLYPQYMGAFGNQIKTVHGEIGEHNKRVNSINEYEIEKLIEELRFTDPTDESIEEIANKLYTDGIAPMMRVISLAMNIDHVSGNISKDYGNYGGMDIDPSFYDTFHERGVEDWDRELKSIIKKK